MKRSLEDLVADYISLSEEYSVSYGRLGQEVCSRLLKRRHKVYLEIRSYGDAGISAMVDLLSHPNRYVKTGAAYEMPWYNRELVLRILREDEKIGDYLASNHWAGIWSIERGPKRDPYEVEQERLAEKRAKKAAKSSEK